jgi:Viral BACON domain
MRGKKEDTLPFVASYLIDEHLPENSEEDDPTQGRLAVQVDQIDALEQRHLPSSADATAAYEGIGEEEAPSIDGECTEIVEADTLSQEECDSWDDQIDPFEQRHLPTSVEAAPIEEADIQRAFAQVETHIISSAPVPPLSPTRPPRPLVSRWRALQTRRKFLVLLALLVVLLLMMDGTLFLLNVTRTHSSTFISGAPTRPILTVTPAATHPGQIVILHLSNFSPSAQVLLTRDMQQTVRTDTGASLIRPGRDGHADVHVLVEDSWGAGTHLLLTEDIHSHYVASVSLQVTSDFPTPLPHLSASTQGEPGGLNGALNFGTDLPEANTIQSLLLRNTGGSWISWQATSDQPWLALAPQQGVFQQSQGVFVAAARAHLTPGYHQGTITITSNAGNPIVIQAVVNVLLPPKTASSLLVVEPPLLSFTATDGAIGPTPRYLTISNPGVQPLKWSLTTSVPQDSLMQNLNEDGQHNSAWLNTDRTSGTVMPGASARIRVMAQTQQLLPGEYGGILLFSVSGNPLIALQPVAVALTVQPRCGVISNPGSLLLALVTGRQASFDQPLAISTTPGCADATNWQGFPLASWLKMTPASGQLQPGAMVKGNLLFDTSTLAPGTYNASVDLLTEMRSLTLMVQLTVLSPSTTMPATTPVSGTSPNSTPSPVPSSAVAPTTPTPTPVPGTPTPVPQPCTLQVTPTNLAFIATLLQPNPPAQTLALSVTGNCPQPVSWSASADAASQGWLHLAAASGVVSNGGATLVVQVNANGKLLGTYTGQITLTAVDHSGTVTRGSPQAVSVTLTVVL